MADDYTGNLLTAGTVAVGGWVEGTIETAGDEDWFAVQLEAGVEYRIDLEGSDTGGGTLADPLLRWLHDDSDAGVRGTRDDDGGSGRNARQVFTPDESGTYYISANGAGTGTGTYKLSVTQVNPPPPAPDPPAVQDPLPDVAANSGTPGVVTVGGSVTGEIGTAGDEDWFAVQLEAGVEYRIDLEGSDTGGGTLADPLLRWLHDDSGAGIPGTRSDGGGDGRNARQVFTPDESGTYYISANGAGSVTGTYKLSVTQVNPPPDDLPASATTTGTVAVGGLATGEIETAGDEDWFAVTLEAGRFYRFDLEGGSANRGTLEDPYLRGIYDAEGTAIPGTSNDNANIHLSSRVEFAADADGTYYVAAGGARGHTGTYTLSVETIPDDYAANETTTGTLAVGGSAAGEIDMRGDRDWFAVTLEAGRTYRIDLEGSFGNRGTLRDPFLRGIYAADGSAIADTRNDNDGWGLDAGLLFTPEADGTYYIAAGGSESSIGTYALSVEDVTDDYPADNTTTGMVAPGGSVEGIVETPDDRDWFAVELEADLIYRIDLECRPAAPNGLSDPYLYGIYDADGALISGTSDDNLGAGQNARVWFIPEADGTYYIAAGSDHRYTGAYTLSVSAGMTVPTDDHPADTTATGTLAVDSPAEGAIEIPGDVDWFAVTLEEGRFYRFHLEGRATADGTLQASYLRGVYDANGNAIGGTSSGDGGSRVWFTPEADGTYYVGAGGYGDHTGAYTLSVEVVADDRPADTTATDTVTVGGSVIGSIDAPHDEDWFMVTLQAGQLYDVVLEGSWTQMGTLQAPRLRGIYDANGDAIPGTVDGSPAHTVYSSSVPFTPDTDGTYYVAAGAVGTDIGTYTLFVKAIPDDETAADTTTTGTVSVGGSVTDELETAGDRDWHATTLQAGQQYQIDLKGSHTADGTLQFPYLRGIHDGDGNLIDGTSDFGGGDGLNARVTFTPDAAGTYYVAAGAFEYVPTGITGTYTLSIEEL